MISFEELGIGSGEIGGFTGIQRYSKSRTSEEMDGTLKIDYDQVGRTQKHLYLYWDPLFYFQNL